MDLFDVFLRLNYDVENLMMIFGDYCYSVAKFNIHIVSCNDASP